MNKTIVILDRTELCASETRQAVYELLLRQTKRTDRRTLTVLMTTSAEEAISLLCEGHRHVPPYFIIANWRIGSSEDGRMAISAIERRFSGAITDAVLMKNREEKEVLFAREGRDNLFVVRGRLDNRNIRDVVGPLLVRFVLEQYLSNVPRFSPVSRSVHPARANVSSFSMS